MNITISEKLKNEIQEISNIESNEFISKKLKEFEKRIQESESESKWIKYQIAFETSEQLVHSYFNEGNDEGLKAKRKVEVLQIYSKYFDLTEWQKQTFKNLLK